jgi:hypothetical protein
MLVSESNVLISTIPLQPVGAESIVNALRTRGSGNCIMRLPRGRTSPRPIIVAADELGASCFG